MTLAAAVLVAGVVVLRGGEQADGPPSSTSPSPSPPSSAPSPPPALPDSDPARCAGAVTLVADPFGPAVADFGGVPARGEGAVGDLEWVVPLGDFGVDFEAEYPPVWQTLGVAGETVVLYDTGLGGPLGPQRLVGRKASDGTPVWSVEIPRYLGGVPAAEGGTPAPDPVLADGAVWAVYPDGDQFRLAALDAASGAVAGCFSLVDARYVTPGSVAPVGGAAYQVVDRPDTDAGEVARLGALGPEWTVAGEFDVVVGGDADVVVFGSQLRRPYADADPQLVGLSTADGSERWRVSMRELLPGAPAFDPGAPAPDWGGDDPAVLRAGLFAAPGQPLAGVGQSGAVTLLWSPATLDAAFGLDAPPWGAYLVSVDAASGTPRYAGVVHGTPQAAPLSGGDAVWLAPAGDRTGWLAVAADGTSATVAPGAARGVTPSGLWAMVWEVDTSDGSEALRLADPSGVAGVLPAESGISAAPGATRLDDSSWIGTLVGDDGAGRGPVLVRYRLSSYR